jgi:tRNA wybutosine-synthesizing protein 3
MNQSKSRFYSYKKIHLKKLSEALQKHHVDEQVISLLNRINSDKRFITTSSCAGRIVVLEVPTLGDKKRAAFHGCWHQSPSFSEIKQAIEKYVGGQLWFLAQPPIFHIAVSDLESANILQKVGIQSGFKNSGIKTLQNQILVELISTERLDMLLGDKGTIYCDDLYLTFLLAHTRFILKR